MLPPSEWIPIAESDGEISHVQRCILEKVCAFLHDSPALCKQFHSVKLNLSPGTFLNRNMYAGMLDVLSTYRIAPSLLQFEITETAATVHDRRSALLYESVVDTMHRLGFAVVVEGAETQNEADFLMAAGVACIQGFYYAKPMPGGELKKLFTQNL